MKCRSTLPTQHFFGEEPFIIGEDGYDKSKKQRRERARLFLPALDKTH